MLSLYGWIIEYVSHSVANTLFVIAATAKSDTKCIQTVYKLCFRLPIDWLLTIASVHFVRVCVRIVAMTRGFRLTGLDLRFFYLYTRFDRCIYTILLKRRMFSFYLCIYSTCFFIWTYVKHFKITDDILLLAVVCVLLLLYFVDAVNHIFSTYKAKHSFF